MSTFIQFLVSGLTVGSMYALTALGIAFIYNVSGLINFAQGEFAMLGGLMTASLVGIGIHLPLAILLSLIPSLVIGVILQLFSSYIFRKSSILEVIIMTVSVALVVQGGAQIVWGKELRTVPAFTSNDAIQFAGASIVPQVLWVLGVSAMLLIAIAYFFNRTTAGKAILATAYNPRAAQMMGINIQLAQILCFSLSALLGALAGIITAPITFAIYDAGLMWGFKGIVAALVGGIGSGAGAVVGGLLLGFGESMTAGYISSQYKDAVPLLAMFVLFMFRPHGIFAGSSGERV